MGKRYILIILITLLFTALLSIVFWYKYKLIPAREEQISWEKKHPENTDRFHVVPILLYHNIDGKGVFSVSRDIMEQHFSILKENNIKVIPLNNFIDRLEKPVRFVNRTVAITFDDGFLSMYSKLLPLSKKYNYPITLFVYTDNIYNRAEKKLTWDKLKELDREGIAVESHSISHADLLKLHKKNSPESRRKLFQEIYLSKRILELYLDKTIKYFAFPYGYYNLPLIQLCNYAGYERVFSTDYGSNVVSRNNYCLRRQHIKKNFSITFIEKIVQ